MAKNNCNYPIGTRLRRFNNRNNTAQKDLDMEGLTILGEEGALVKNIAEVQVDKSSNPLINKECPNLHKQTKIKSKPRKRTTSKQPQNLKKQRSSYVSDKRLRLKTSGEAASNGEDIKIYVIEGAELITKTFSYEEITIKSNMDGQITIKTKYEGQYTMIEEKYLNDSTDNKNNLVFIFKKDKI